MSYNLSYMDPIAQSFLITASEGIFLTSVDIFFASKDDTAPVTLQVRDMVNGVPSSIFDIPNGQVVLGPDDITSNEYSTDLETIQSNPTRFTFNTPVYLKGGAEYALVLITPSDNYNVYVAKAGDFIIGRTDKRILSQPTLGSFFLSQNSTTYTADQERDLMYRVRGATFNSGATAIIKNKTLENYQLVDDALKFDSGSAFVDVYAPNCGLSVGDDIILRGFDSADSAAGISFSRINGTHTVTKVDGLGVQIQLDSAANTTGFFGASGSSMTRNVIFEKAIVQIPTYIPTGSELYLNTKFTTGLSIVEADQGQHGYGLASNFDTVPINKTITFDDEKMVAAEKNEIDNMAGEKSFQSQLDMFTTSGFISPVIDVTEMNLETIHHSIDFQDSATSSLFYNVPRQYISETDAFLGSALSKHLTIPIVLEEPAVGLKILMSANRPPEAQIDVYYRTLPSGSDKQLSDIPFVLATQDTIIPSDNNKNKFRQYEYTIGGLGGYLSPFTAFQIKMVLNTRNNAKYPRIRDLRAIALGT